MSLFNFSWHANALDHVFLVGFYELAVKLTH